MGKAEGLSVLGNGTGLSFTTGLSRNKAPCSEGHSPCALSGKEHEQPTSPDPHGCPVLGVYGGGRAAGGLP